MKAALVLAEALARVAHSAQVEAHGRRRPYIDHVAAVVAGVAGDEAQIVAWLHDVIEDTDLTALDLAYRGIPPRLVRSVERLTRSRDMPYDAYIATLLDSGDRLAIAVKRADLDDHLHDSCPDHLRPRYEAARAALDAPHD